MMASEYSHQAYTFFSHLTRAQKHPIYAIWNTVFWSLLFFCLFQFVSLYMHLMKIYREFTRKFHVFVGTVVTIVARDVDWFQQSIYILPPSEISSHNLSEAIIHQLDHSQSTFTPSLNSQAITQQIFRNDPLSFSTGYQGPLYFTLISTLKTLFKSNFIHFLQRLSLNKRLHTGQSTLFH